MKGLNRVVVDLVLVLLSVVLIIGLFMLVIGFVVPDSVANLKLGAGLFESQVTEQTGTIVRTVHINPILDALLAVGAYVLVSLISWSQDQLTSWFTNRRHFE